MAVRDTTTDTHGTGKTDNFHKRLGIRHGHPHNRSDVPGVADGYITRQKTPTKSSQLRTGGVTQAGIASDLDNLEDPQAPDTGEPPAQTPGATPGQPPVPGTTPGAGGGRT